MKPLSPTPAGTTNLPFPQLVTADVIAAWLNVTVRRVYELARYNLIPQVKLGRNVRFDPDEVQQWIRSGGTPLPGGWRREPHGDQE